MRILVVEDNQRVANFLVRGLKAEGHQTSLAEDGQKGLEMALRETPDVIILDRMLPLMDGMEVLQELRSRRVPARILILSAMSELADKVSGLKMGADDYMTKPFEFEELLARIESLSRRVDQSTAAKVYTYRDLSMNLETLEVKRNEKSIVLTPKELAILELLIANPKKVFSRERILANVWDSNEDPMTNIVDVYIKKLRSKIDSDFEVGYIKTYRGMGYSLNAEDESS